MKFSTFAIAIAVVFMALIMVPSVYAEEPGATVTIPVSSLTPQQKVELTAKELADKQAAYGKWVGIGDEVGKAVNSGLAAITTQTNNFASTPVGKWTIFVIIFKVIGDKVVGYLVGFSVFAVGIPIWLWSYRKIMPHKYVRKVTYAADGKTKVSIEYGETDAEAEWAASHWLALVAIIVVGLICLFVGN